jgi:hypothetical protein
MERIPALAGGPASWFGVWAPGTVVRTQCDASAFLSPRQYERSFLQHDERICRSAEYSVIHLHSGSLHTVDAILAVPAPQAIQVSLDPPPSGPNVARLLPVFQRILKSKPLIVDGVLSADQIKMLEDTLPEDGRCIIARCEWQDPLVV